jgi:hypothetical protein
MHLNYRGTTFLQVQLTPRKNVTVALNKEAYQVVKEQQ